MVTITSKRHTRTDKSTISDLFLEECGFFCHVLEDKDRGLTKETPLEEIRKTKKAGETAIPSGTYDVQLLVSPAMSGKIYAQKYGGRFPCLLNVPGFDGILIHPGNSAKDTRGCLLVGDYDPKSPDYISNSVKAYEALMDFYLWPAFKRGDKIQITIE